MNLRLVFSCFFWITIFVSYAQQSSSFQEIVQKIHELEKNKDPKCYATANRLEDFMYGTPLNDLARNLKIQIQKEIILYLKQKASQNAIADHSKKITTEHLQPIIQELSTYKKLTSGDYEYQLPDDTIKIAKLDYDQYASISYCYRSLLSVEQDLLFSPKANLLPFDKDAISYVNDYLNISTLVVLKIADEIARAKNQPEITPDIIKTAWIKTFQKEKPLTQQKTNAILSTNEGNHDLIQEIIKQKIASYKQYNNINPSLFLRNIQVYFARQKWPTDLNTSKTLKDYYLESLIQFTTSLLQQSHHIATQRKHPIIRVADIQYAANSFLPIEVNSFEDVLFFPNNIDNNISIESYDLDAFRDSSFHWRILDYTLQDKQAQHIKTLDPNAVELVVENIAHMGVLVLRIAGSISKSQEKTALDINDINAAFSHIQQLINSYPSFAPKQEKTTIASANATSSPISGFSEIASKIGISFHHKSSDWLSRHIRSFTTSYQEQKIKLAIPPAFGGAGVACEDINNDGLIDVLLLGGFGNKLFLNTQEGSFNDISSISNINYWDPQLRSYGEPRQPIIADFNNDGLQDIFITYVNAPHRLYQNIDGTHFTDVSMSSNLGGINAVAGPATTFDYNNDGLLDIFIGYFGNYITGDLPTLSRDNQNGMPNKLFKNLGNFVFEEVSFIPSSITNSGWTQAVGHADLNQDGLQDIIVGNDFGVNKYFLNSSTGVFTESSKQLGTDKPSYTMNIGISDLNRDMFPDLYISNIVVMQKDEKYVSPNKDTQMKFDPKKMANIRTVEANDLFLSNIKSKRLHNYQLSTNIGRGYSSTGWSWDADFFDYDNDGDEDLYCLNGMNDFSVYSTENPFYFEREDLSKAIQYAESNREKNVFFINDNGQLINKAKALGVDLYSNARSASYFDYDNDGDLDIIINNYHDTANVLQNNTSSTNHWLKIKLIGSPKHHINRDAIGSSIIVSSKHHKNLWREIHSTTGYLSVHPKIQHFGIGSDTTAKLTVKWSNGEVFTFKNLNANESYHITYPNILKKI
ncbi:CRTAC1 family protein [Aquimarina rhabdastrellae]